MRKLKLQMQISLDGFVSDNEGKNFNWDDEVKAFSIANTEGVDRIILGRITAEGFIPHWASVASNPEDSDFAVGRTLTDIPKIVFSNTLDKSKWANVELAKGDTTEEINKLKNQPGNDLIVYGGSSFVSSLIKEKLIDQYYLLVNPFAIGSGLTIFQSLQSKLALTLSKSRQFNCGTVLLTYESKN
jgi:dihydrofolate reductase